MTLGVYEFAASGTVIEVEGLDLLAGLVTTATDAASDAAASAAAAEAAAASIGSTTIVLDQPPASNLGALGDRLLDTKNGAVYLSKSDDGWLSPIVPSVDAVTGAAKFVEAAAPELAVERVELRKGAAWPSADYGFSRASVSTGLLYQDPYTSPYGSASEDFGVDEKVLRDDGWGRWTSAKNFLLNSDAPVTQTTTQSLQPGKAYLLAWGPPGTSVAVSAGTATGSGWGTLNGDAQSFRELTITGAGTVTVTVTGALAHFDVQQCPGNEGASAPAPHIRTTGAPVTRAADFAPATTAMKAWYNAGGGRMLVIGTDKVAPVYSPSPSLLGLNGVTALYAGLSSGNPSLTIYTISNNTAFSLIGGSSWQSPVRSALAWDSSASMTFGGGLGLEKELANHFNEGSTVTGAQLGGFAASGDGAGNLNGLITYYEKYTSRPADAVVYDTFSQLAPITPGSFIKDFDPADDAREFKRAYDRLQAGAIDVLLVPWIGPSHLAGINPEANAYASSPGAFTAERLTAKGYAASQDAAFGGNGVLNAGTTNVYNNRLKASSGVTFTGKGPGGELFNIPAGEWIELDPVLATAKMGALAALDPSYGTYALQVDNGAGWTTVNTFSGVGTAGTMAVTSVTATLGARKWRALGVTGTSVLSGVWAYDPAAKLILFMNWSRSGYTASDISSPLYLAAIQTLAAPQHVISPDDTNDANGLTATSSYEASADALAAAATAVGGVLWLVDPASQTTTITQAVQDKYKRLSRGAARKRHFPIADIWQAQGGTDAAYRSATLYLDDLHLRERGNRRWGYAIADGFFLPALRSM